MIHFIAEDSYKESTVHLQDIRDKLTLWAGSDDDEDEEVTESVPVQPATQTASLGPNFTLKPKFPSSTTSSTGTNVNVQSKPFGTESKVQDSMDYKLSDSQIKIMDSLISSQNANGSWYYKPEDLYKLLNLEEKIDKAALDPEFDDTCWITALIISYLTIVLKFAKDDWEFVVEKATEFLQKQSKQFYLNSSNNLFSTL